MRWRLLLLCLWGASAHAHDNTFHCTRGDTGKDVVSQLVEAAGPYGVAVTVAHGIYSFVKERNSERAEPPPPPPQTFNLEDALKPIPYPTHSDFLRTHQWERLANMMQRGFADLNHTLGRLQDYTDRELYALQSELLHLLQHLGHSQKNRDRAARLGNIGRFRTTKVPGDRWWQKEKVPALQHFAIEFLQKVDRESLRRGEVAQHRQAVLRELAPRLKNNARREKRLEAIEHTVAAPREIFEKRFDVRKNKLCLHHSQGNAVQQNIHQELVDIINSAYDRSSIHTQIIEGAVEVAFDHKYYERYERAYNMSDFCWNVLDTTAETIKTVATGVGRGMSQFSDMCKSFLDNFTYDPLNTTREMAYSMLLRFYEIDDSYRKRLREKYGIEDEPGYLATNGERSAYARYCRDASAEQFREEMQKVKSHLLTIFTRFRDDPREATIDGIAWTTEMVLSFGLCDVGITRTRNLVGPLVDGLKLEIANRTGKINVAHESSKLIVHALEETTLQTHKVKLMKNAIDVVKKNPELIEHHGTFHGATKEMFQIQKDLVKRDLSLANRQELLKQATEVQCKLHQYNGAEKTVNLRTSFKTTAQNAENIAQTIIGKDGDYFRASNGIKGFRKDISIGDKQYRLQFRYPKPKSYASGNKLANFELFEYKPPEMVAHGQVKKAKFIKKVNCHMEITN